jgi:hypothetical protein
VRCLLAAAVAKGPRMQEMSEAIPFMPKPKNVDSSMAGYSGFDPMGFSDYYDVKWLREAEIKHGRVCMLAVVGMVFPLLTTPHPLASSVQRGTCRMRDETCSGFWRRTSNPSADPSAGGCAEEMRSVRCTD